MIILDNILIISMNVFNIFIVVHVILYISRKYYVFRVQA